MAKSKFLGKMQESIYQPVDQKRWDSIFGKKERRQKMSKNYTEKQREELTSILGETGEKYNADIAFLVVGKIVDEDIDIVCVGGGDEDALLYGAVIKALESHAIMREKKKNLPPLKSK